MDANHTHVETGKRSAGLFDIRAIIGLLIGVYGLVLLLMGIFGSEASRTKADGLNINLWSGLGMIVFGLAFLTWAKLRPIVVPSEDTDDAEPGVGSASGSGSGESIFDS